MKAGNNRRWHPIIYKINYTTKNVIVHPPQSQREVSSLMVLLNRIKPWVDKIRQKLKTLCDSYLQNAKTKSAEARLNILREIAEQGSMLREELIPQGIAPKLPLDENESVLFKVRDDAPFLIPWGLLFDHVEGKKYSELTRPELEDNFWGSKYRVSCTFFIQEI